VVPRRRNIKISAMGREQPSASMLGYVRLSLYRHSAVEHIVQSGPSQSTQDMGLYVG
jgi:hypothetical protein